MNKRKPTYLGSAIVVFFAVFPACGSRPGLDRVDAEITVDAEIRPDSEIPSDGAIFDAAPPMACGESDWMADGWPMYMGCPERRGRSKAIGPASPDNIRSLGETWWETETHGVHIDGLNIGPVVDADGTAYIGSHLMYLMNEYDIYEFWSQLFQAFDSEGTELWRFETQLCDVKITDLSNAPPIGVPTLAGDSVYYFLTRECSKFSLRELFSFDHEGRQNWTSQDYRETRDLIVGPDGNLYFSENTLGNNRIISLDPDGVERWSFYPGSLRTSLLTMDAEGRIYFGADGVLYSIDQDGNLLWTEKVADSNSISLSLGDNGEIYFTGRKSEEEEPQRFLYAVSKKDGSLLWSQPVTSPGPSVAVGPGGMVVLVTEDGVVAFSPEGHLLWTYEQLSSLPGSPAIDGEGTIYLAGRGIFAIERDGKLKWQTDEVVASAVAIGADGSLYAYCRGRGAFGGSLLCVIEP